MVLGPGEAVDIIQGHFQGTGVLIITFSHCCLIPPIIKMATSLIYLSQHQQYDDGFTTVRGKQAKRQRVSSGQSGSMHNAFLDIDDDNMTDYGSLTTDNFPLSFQK